MTIDINFIGTLFLGAVLGVMVFLTGVVIWGELSDRRAKRKINSAVGPELMGIKPYAGQVYCRMCKTTLEKYVINREEGFDEFTGRSILLNKGISYMVCGIFHKYMSSPSGSLSRMWNPLENGHAIFLIPEDLDEGVSRSS